MQGSSGYQRKSIRVRPVKVDDPDEDQRRIDLCCSEAHRNIIQRAARGIYPGNMGGSEDRGRRADRMFLCSGRGKSVA